MKSKNNVYFLTLSGQVLSNQSIYLQRGKIRFLKKEAVKLKKDWIEQIRLQWDKQPLQTNLHMEIFYYHGDKRKRDVDNYAKLVLDVMQGIVFVDDSQIQSLFLYKKIDIKNPRVEIKFKILAG